MKQTSARRRAEACFRLARSTPYPAERAAAIARGKAIVASAALDPALFDIPGELRPRPKLQTVNYSTSSRSQNWAFGLEKAIVRCERAFDETAAAVGAQAGETIYDARRRNFEEATREAAERDRQRGRGR